MFVLPQILLLGEKITDKTAFNVSMPIKAQKNSGIIRVDGYVSGQINGKFVGEMHGIITGDVNAIVEIGDVHKIDGQEDTEHDSDSPPTEQVQTEEMTDETEGESDEKQDV